MARFYKGVGTGTFWHKLDARVNGLTPRNPGALYNLNSVMTHIARATTRTPCISLTRSFGVAQMYAKDASITQPSRALPAYVYEVDFPASPAGCAVIDPVAEVFQSHANPFSQPSYHHDGDMNFMLGVVDPVNMIAHRSQIALMPTGAMGRPPTLTIEFETMVRALRDAEVLVIGTIPSANVIDRHDVY